MDKSLAELVKTTTKFEHTDKHFTPEQQKLLRRKEVYPYDYMTDFSKLSETKPPPREAFNSWLNSAGAVSSTNEFDEMEPVEITDEDYDHFKKMLERSGSKTLGDLTEFYVKGDTFQLADVFENFIGVCMEKYGLDPSYYVTAAHLANDAMMKVTGNRSGHVSVLRGKQTGWRLIGDEKIHEGEQQVHEELRPGKA